MAWGSGKWSLGKALRNLVSQPEITEQTWEDLEDTLLGADFGPDVTDALLSSVRAEVDRIGTTKPDDVQAILTDSLEAQLAEYDPTLRLTERPAVVMVVGVNGVGKTTTIGKFAKFLTNAGRSVVIAAADTFRAAAVEQLTTWADRAGVPLVGPDKEGQDPASVAFQAVTKAKEEGIDIVIVDTAGRLHTKSGLMDELTKIRRVVEKVAPVSEVLLVLDATTGQNGVVQAQAFLEHAGVTGLVLTKVDGSAKGGFVLSVQEKTGLPIKLLGQGEGIGDMTGFAPASFAKSLVED
ncbi:signal recognition particle-docking protein FtsY [Pontimonas sp.]|nr:signal recognition particle-docking protein FtsY [Pontimonas sp.]MDA8862820.1 signal recognition particle-docking protein FtsY [Pontimonas sp.]